MMEWTDTHCRVLHRLLSRHAVLYTEMVTADAVIHGVRERLIGFDASEHPVVLQLGGSVAAKLAQAAAIGVARGYDAINLNCGCPSDRVQSGRFGASLMAEPELVAACVRAMRDAVPVPVTVKCRIGIDDQDSETDFQRFIDVVAAAGCQTFIVHARKAWLQGLSPKQNREVPPLDYARVIRLKAARPDLTVVVNGGIHDLDAAVALLAAGLDGVMLGRAAYQTPWLLAEVDRRLYAASTLVPSRAVVLKAYMAYAERALAAGWRLGTLIKPVLGLYHGEHNGRLFRRILSEQGNRAGAGVDVLETALAAVKETGVRHLATLIPGRTIDETSIALLAQAATPPGR